MPDSAPIAGVETSIAAFVGPTPCGPANEPTQVTSFVEYERAFGGLDLVSTTGFAVRDFFANGGRKALIVRIVSHDIIGSATRQTGIYSLQKADLFNLLCLPAPARNHADPERNRTSPEVYRRALELCAGRRAMLLVDPDPRWGTNRSDVVRHAIAGAESLGLDGSLARNAALYFPCVLVSDPLAGGRTLPLAPSGAVAGIMARTDSNRGVWKAPAGVEATLEGVQGLQVTLSDIENGELNRRGINCLRTFAGGGRHVVWGARTMRGADAHSDEYKYIPVRRFALFIEESIVRGTKWTVFEPNGEGLWSKLRHAIVAFMQGLFRRGALQGVSPDDAYFVKCDATTTTQRDIDAGIVNIEVGFAPLKPAEFVIVRIQQLAKRARC